MTQSEVSENPRAQRRRLYLDAALYLSLLALAGFSVTLIWAMAGIVEGYLLHNYGNRPLPVTTQYALKYKALTLCVTLPWLLAAGVLLKRRMHDSFTRTAFCSSLIMSVVMVSILYALALTMPFFQVFRAISSGKRSNPPALRSP